LIVIDASVLANALTDDGDQGGAARSALAADPYWVGPDHLIIETCSAIRGRLLGGLITDTRAAEAINALAAAEIELMRVSPLLTRIWELRSNVNSHDAACVASAEALAVPLLTADKRLSRASGIRCQIRLALPDEPSAEEHLGL
jgi:predicted nucleic acid-binding protein